MGNYYDAWNGVKWAWQKFRDSEMLKWGALYAAVSALYGILQTTLVKGMATADPLAGTGALLASFALFVVVLVVFMACIMYLLPRLYRSAMKLSLVKVSSTIPNVLEMFAFSVYLVLVNIFAWYDKKLIAPGVVLAALGLVVFLVLSHLAGIALMALGGLLWLVGYMVHTVRTMFSPYAYLRGDGSITQAPALSARMVRGQTWEVFSAYFTTIAITGLIVLIPAIVLLLIVAVIALSLGGAAGSPTLVGSMVEQVLLLPFIALWTAYIYVLQANIFAFYDKAGRPTMAVGGAKATGKVAKKK